MGNPIMFISVFCGLSLVGGRDRTLHSLGKMPCVDAILSATTDFSPVLLSVFPFSGLGIQAQ